jgi:ABC-2 type transport system permease protein
VSRLPAYASATRAVLERDCMVFLSYRWQFASQMLAAAFSLVLFHYLAQLVDVPAFRSPADYFGYVVVGLVIVQILQSTLGIPQQLRADLVAGTFERVVQSPFGEARAILAMTLFPFVYSLALGTVTLVLAAAVFALPVVWETVPLAIPVALLGAAAFAAFGLLFAALVLVVKRATGAAWLVTLVSILGGLYFPVSILPGWIRWAADVQPFTPSVDLLRHLIAGYPLRNPAWADVLTIAAFAAVLLPFATWLVGRAARRSRRRGTITEF